MLELEVLLILVIVWMDYLQVYFEGQVEYIKVMEYEDYYYFIKYDVGQFKVNFDCMEIN